MQLDADPAADVPDAQPVAGQTNAVAVAGNLEAVNAVERRYMPYKFKLPVEGTASKEAAAAAAANAVLLALHSDRQRATSPAKPLD